MMPVPSALDGLVCARCATAVDADPPRGFCPCGGTWLARYDAGRARRSLTRDALRGRPPGLWRWSEMLPVRDPAFRRGLGEGGTPLCDAPRLGRAIGVPRLRLKDEGRNPGGSFKARGMAVALARSMEQGLRSFALPSAGNAGAAAAAYAAAWGASVQVAIPRGTPAAFRREIEAHGAVCHDVDGDIAAAGRWLAAHPDAPGWHFLSTLREPWRVEGKKTMGYELVEQMGGRWPAVVVYPTGGGTGIIGMIKADLEMRALDLVDGPPPRFVVVQAEGCAPIVRAFERGDRHAEPWSDPVTEASGLRVPATIGDHLILDALRDGGGTAIAVGEDAIRDARLRLARGCGILAAPEAAATLAAAAALAARGWIREEDEVVLFLTGNGFKYPLEAEEPA